MNRLFIFLLLFIIIACSGKTVSNENTYDENSSLSSLLDRANKEISNLGESASDKDGIIESITQELASKIENLDFYWFFLFFPSWLSNLRFFDLGFGFCMSNYGNG